MIERKNKIKVVNYFISETFQTIARLFDLFDTVGFDEEIFKSFIESVSGTLE